MRNFILLCFSFLSLAASAQKPDYNKRLKELGITLPEGSKPVANYLKAVRVGNLLFLSGHGPARADGSYITGEVGQDLSIDQGYEAARQTTIQLLATLKAEIGDLNKVKRVIKVFGMVNCLSDFTEQPKVINGCSDLLVAIFGESGKHARSAVGINALPLNTTVEIEIIVEVE